MFDYSCHGVCYVLLNKPMTQDLYCHSRGALLSFEIVQGRLKEDKETYAFFLDVQKACDTV